jgi:1,4-dihydroxy-2-naphthoyl-CoA synthase
MPQVRRHHDPGTLSQELGQGPAFCHHAPILFKAATVAHETILMGKRDQVGFITLNRSDKIKPFSRHPDRELNQAWRQADADDRVRAVVVKGAGTSVSAGTDAFLSKRHIGVAGKVSG